MLYVARILLVCEVDVSIEQQVTVDNAEQKINLYCDTVERMKKLISNET